MGAAAHVVAIVLLILVILGCAALASLGVMRRLYLLMTGKVPLHRIVRFVLIMIVCLIVLYPVLRHAERKSPLHLVVKPQAEGRVRNSLEVKQLIGDSLAFGSERSFSYSDQGQTGTGYFSLPVKGSLGEGLVEVTASKSNYNWQIDTIEIEAKGKRFSIPSQ